MKSFIRQLQVLFPTLAIAFSPQIGTSSGQYGSDAKTTRTTSFHWPQGKKAALSLSFDDARLSQPDVGFPLFQQLGVKATFYVSIEGLQARLPAWKEAVKAGHEIGNHSLRHACSGNFPWSRERSLEDYTLGRMRQELLEANQQINSALGVTPVTFAPEFITAS